MTFGLDTKESHPIGWCKSNFIVSKHLKNLVLFVINLCCSFAFSISRLAGLKKVIDASCRGVGGDSGTPH